MKTRLLLVRLAGAAAIAATLSACGAAPVALALGQACTPDNDGKAVSLEGYLSSRTAVSCNDYDGTYRCMLDMTEKQGADPGSKAGVDIAVGTGGNQMDEPPSDYTDADIKVRAADGTLVPVGQKVRATGKFSYAGSDVCFVTADKLERV